MSDEAIPPGTREHYGSARYYDQAYRRRRQDVRFYVEEAEAAFGPVLELGVGTGRVALSIARAGVAITGVDLLPNLLARFEERLSKEPKRVRELVTLREADMRSARLGQRFPLVIAPFNAFMHLYTRDDIERALATVRAHLAPGGVFVFDVLLPDPAGLSRNPERLYSAGKVRWPEDGERYDYKERFRYDATTQTQHVHMFFLHPTDERRAHVQRLAHRQFFPAELEALLHYNGFRIEERFGDFAGEPLDEYAESQVLRCRLRDDFEG